jgi:uncharacterized protein (DUF58 family)
VAHLLVDGSESMKYGSGEVTKLDYAKMMAACLAYLILHQRDATALCIFDEDIREYLPRSDNRDNLFKIMTRLADFDPTGATQIAKILHHMANQVRRKGIVIVISDFFDDEDEVIEGIQHLRFAGHEVILMQVLDPYELEFPFSGMVEFQGLEAIPNIQTRPSQIRKTYLKEFGQFQERLQDTCERNECHFVPVRTDQALDQVLTNYLAFRRTTAGS